MYIKSSIYTNTLKAMMSKKQDKNYDNEVSTFDLGLALFIMSVSIITLNSLLCVGTMIYTNSLASTTSTTTTTPLAPLASTTPAINKNLFTGIWYKVDSNYSNLHIYQNNDISFKNESNTELVNGYIDYKSNLIYMSGGGCGGCGGGSCGGGGCGCGGGSSNNIVYNISYVHRVNNAYSFTILYDKACKKYYVYRKYDYVVNIAFITKLVESLQRPQL
jgi:uncharacterized membrane protein YgcG